MTKLGRVYTLWGMIRDRKTNWTVSFWVIRPGTTEHSIDLVLTHYSRPPAPADAQLASGPVSRGFSHRELLAG
jgi:hypothetical protein